VNTAAPLTDTTQTFTLTGLTRAQLANGVYEIRVRASRGNSNTAVTASLNSVSVRVDYTAQVPTSITVNAVGATTARGADSFTYDQANRLTTATVAGVSETYTYDGDGVRFSRQVGAGPVIRYVTDPAVGLPVTIDDGVRKYVWGQGLAYAVSGTTLEVYHTDRLGSVRAITDAAGAVTATWRTDEFGIPTASTGTSSQPFAFTGEPRDATGLTYLRARYYDPSLGRFMSRDPLVGNPRSCQTLNRYAYVGNNPVTYADPSGLVGPRGRGSPVGGTKSKSKVLVDDGRAEAEQRQARCAAYFAVAAIDAVAFPAEVILLKAHLAAGPIVPIHAALVVGDVAFLIVQVGTFVIHRVACE